jgi:hypothetical protein
MEKQFEVAIISLAGAAAAWTLILNNCFSAGEFRAPSWFFLTSGILSTFHVGLFSAYVHYGSRSRDAVDWLQRCFIVVAFAVPFLASYFTPWYFWSARALRGESLCYFQQFYCFCWPGFHRW